MPGAAHCELPPTRQSGGGGSNGGIWAEQGTWLQSDNRVGGVGRLIVTFSLCVFLVCKFPSPVIQDKLLFYYTLKQEMLKLLVGISGLSL